MDWVFDRRNLIYGDYTFIFDLLDEFLVIALGDYHGAPLFDKFLFDYKGYFVPAYNREQFRRAVDEALEIDVPIVVTGISRLFEVSEYPWLNSILSRLLIHGENVFIVTEAMKSRQFPPPPKAPHFLRHMCDVVAFSRRGRNSYVLFVVKHPYLPYMKVSMRWFYGKELPELPKLLESATEGYRASK